MPRGLLPQTDLLLVVLLGGVAMGVLGVVVLLPRVGVAEALLLSVALTRHDGLVKRDGMGCVRAS